MNDIANPVAEKIAQWACDERFPVHHGTGPFSDGAWIYLFDNHPYVDEERRPREHEALIQTLAAEGVELIGRGTNDDGYTVALVLDYLPFPHARDVRIYFMTPKQTPLEFA